MSKREIATLQSAIDRADQLYYGTGNTAKLTDDQYEAMKTRLRQLSPNDDRLSRIGVPYSNDQLRNKEDHSIPMGSLDNTEGGIGGFADWYDWVCEHLTELHGNEEVELVCSLKMDGISAGADYKDGSLTRVLSRGDGAVGDNITWNGSRWIGLPSSLPTDADLTVRGEVVLYKEDFDAINEVDGGEHANPRNLCSGITGRSNGQDNDKLNFRAFNMVGGNFKTLEDKFKAMEAMGFNVVDHTVIKGNHTQVIEAVSKFFNLLESEDNGGGGGREKLEFEIDGVVIALNDLSLQKSLETDLKSKLRPKHSRAIKFVSQKNTTVVIGCEITMGHTGALIPTAKLEPIQIGGVTVSSALLNNWNPDSSNPSAAHIAIGDTVEVELAGDIIPKITQVVVEAVENRQTIAKPTEWGGKPTTNIHRGVETVVVYAQLDEDSPQIVKQKLKHWIGTSKKGTGILGVGDGVLTALTVLKEGDAPKVTSPADLYRLELADLENMAIGTTAEAKPIRLGNRRATALLAEIEKSKTLTLPKFLGALGIDLLGKRRVELLVKGCGLLTLSDWLDKAKTAKIPGDVTRKAIVEGIDSCRPLIEDLLSVGIKVDGYVAIPEVLTVTVTDDDDNVHTSTVDSLDVSLPTEEAPTGSAFAGKSFCFTGTRTHQDTVEALGGIIKSGVSKKLDYLVQKSPTSKSNKSKKADDLGVRVICIEVIADVLAGKRDLPSTEVIEA